MPKIDWNLGLIWAAITSTIGAVLWMFSTFATAAEVSEIKLDIAYGQFYDRLGEYRAAVEAGEDGLAEELLEQLERLRATICNANPQWQRCEVLITGDE